MNKTLPRFYTRSEVKRFVFQCQHGKPHLRYGQAVCDQYDVPKHVEDIIWEMKEFEQVVQVLFDYNNIRGVT